MYRNWKPLLPADAPRLPTAAPSPGGRGLVSFGERNDTICTRAKGADLNYPADRLVKHGLHERLKALRARRYDTEKLTPEQCAQLPSLRRHEHRHVMLENIFAEHRRIGVGSCEATSPPRGGGGLAASPSTHEREQLQVSLATPSTCNATTGATPPTPNTTRDAAATPRTVAAAPSATAVVAAKAHQKRPPLASSAAPAPVAANVTPDAALSASTVTVEVVISQADSLQLQFPPCPDSLPMIEVGTLVIGAPRVPGTTVPFPLDLALGVVVDVEGRLDAARRGRSVSIAWAHVDEAQFVLPKVLLSSIDNGRFKPSVGQIGTYHSDTQLRTITVWPAALDRWMATLGEKIRRNFGESRLAELHGVLHPGVPLSTATLSVLLRRLDDRIRHMVQPQCSQSRRKPSLTHASSSKSVGEVEKRSQEGEPGLRPDEDLEANEEIMKSAKELLHRKIKVHWQEPGMESEWRIGEVVGFKVVKLPKGGRSALAHEIKFDRVDKCVLLDLLGCPQYEQHGEHGLHSRELLNPVELRRPWALLEDGTSAAEENGMESTCDSEPRTPLDNEADGMELTFDGASTSKEENSGYSQENGVNSQGMLHPLCARGYKHKDKGGVCSFSKAKSTSQAEEGGAGFTVSPEETAKAEALVHRRALQYWRIKVRWGHNKIKWVEAMVVGFESWKHRVDSRTLLNPDELRWPWVLLEERATTEQTDSMALACDDCAEEPRARLFEGGSADQADGMSLACDEVSTSKEEKSVNSQCKLNPLCVRGYKHKGKGGVCSFSKPKVPLRTEEAGAGFTVSAKQTAKAEALVHRRALQRIRVHWFEPEGNVPVQWYTGEVVSFEPRGKHTLNSRTLLNPDELRRPWALLEEGATAQQTDSMALACDDCAEEPRARLDVGGSAEQADGVSLACDEKSSLVHDLFKPAELWRPWALLHEGESAEEARDGSAAETRVESDEEAHGASDEETHGDGDEEAREESDEEAVNIADSFTDESTGFKKVAVGQCERNPLCTRGAKHMGQGGHCQLPKGRFRPERVIGQCERNPFCPLGNHELHSPVILNPEELRRPWALLEKGENSDCDSKEGFGTSDRKMRGKSETRMYFSIRDDETPASIAQLHGVDVRSLIDLNKQRFPDLRPRSKLPKGSSLKLPCDSNDWTLAHHWVGAGVRDQSNGIGEIFQACAIKHDGETTEDVRFRARYDTLEIELSWMEARTQILEWLRTDKPEETLLQVLFECFEFWKFREHQEEELIKTVLNGGDLLCVASTGFGKSLLYQLPGLFVHLRSNKCVLVISPLIALMEDQVARLNSKSLKRGASEVAAFIGSAQTDPFVEPRAKAGEFALVYATPEKLFFPGSTFLSDIRERLAFVVIDEAHCISEWGHDFRPEFSELSKLRHHQWLLCPKVPIIAVTATAKRDVRDHICDVLNLRSPTIKVLPIYRHNLRLHCFDRIDTSILNEVYDRLRNFDSAIIYTSKRKKAEELCQKLKEEGILADFYHAGMSAAERSAAQQRFMNNETTAICATTAFGMGIDKSDVRLVVHWTAPKNFDAYIQEIGRGGRDGKPAECWMITQGSDFTNWENDHYRPRYGDSRDNFMVGVESLRTYFHSVDKCRWAQIISYSEGEESARSQLPNGCGFCDNCTARSGGKTEHRDFAAVAVLLLWAIDVCLQKSHARRCRCHNPSEYGVTKGDDDIPMPFEDADVVEDEGGVPISVPAREICDSETVPMVVDIDGKKIIMDIDDAENPTQTGGAEPTPTPMAIDDDLNPTRVGGSKRRRVITDSDDDDNHSSRFARRTWDSNAEAIVSEHWEHVRRSADAEIVAIDEKWARVPFVLRFALLVVGVEERHVSVDLLNDLLELSSVTPPNFRECERRMQQLHQEIRVLRPPQGKTIMYEAELSSIGTWQYAMYIHGDTIAHSELGAENILKVVVPDLPYNDVEKHQTLLAQKSNLSTHKLFGRNFVFFGIKSDHSMVNSRAFLIAEQSRGPGLVWNSADEARQLLADFRQVQANPAKMSKRMEHAFSKTFRALADFNLIEVDEPNGVSILNAVEYLRRQPPVPDNEVHVIVMDDTYGSGLDAKGNTAIMTDGNGLISSNLSSTFPQVSSGQCIGDPDEAVLVTQYRQWLGGSLDKGTLTTDARLPPGWIVIPKSSRKISGSKDCSARERGISRFEINNTFDFSTRARLNVNLIQLLEHLARRPEEMRAYLLRLQQKEVERVRTVADHRASRAERIRTIRNLQGNAFRRGVTDHASPATLLLAGFEPSKEPFLQKSLAKYEIDELKSIREGKINLPYSYNLVGVCDPSGSLPAGTVCVVVEGVAIGQSMVGSTTDVPKVVIYRAPGCTEGDLREVEHRKTPELMQVLEGLPAPRCNAIFFSSHGNRSLADEMAGGDLDGDIFVVIADPNIVGNVHTKDAWRADRVAMDRNVQRAAKKTSASTGSELVDHFLKIRHSTCSTVGSCANQLLAVADLHGLSHPDAATLGTVYYHALDGEITEAPKLSLSLKQWPCWMESRTNRTGITFVRTNSILSDMWCTNLGCDSERDGESMPRDDERTTFHVDRDLDLSRDVHTGDKRSIHDFERLVKKWKKLRKDYGHRMQRLLSAHGVTDSDSVSAAALDAVFDDEAKAKISELYQFYRQILFDAHTSADEEDFFPVIVANKQSLLFEASALFVASYAISSSTVGAKQSGGLQFPWRVAGDLLCELKCIRMAQRQGSSSSYHFNPQSLQALLGGRS
ncbi:hypothetical protein AB1Y20_007552 [Prymnesium parvum]|uniref:DNA 3'-5' helicase n=1 Tax=Prymnesium parvum TaxID=97485 RepID=A0AB34IY81_PRYPA